MLGRRTLTSRKDRSKQGRSISLTPLLAAIVVLAFGLQILAFRSHCTLQSDIVGETTVGLNSALAAEKKTSFASQLPAWISNYAAWHQQARRAFPGATLFTDPSAPPILIRTCLGVCGGLNDRLGQLPWDLYLANQTGRLLLLHWHRPAPLENFLLPTAELDWSVPHDVDGFFPTGGARDARVSREGMNVLRKYKELFEGLGDEAHPDKKFWETHLDAAIQRATTGSFKNIKVLRHRLLGHLHEHVLEARLRVLGETDMLHWTPSFGKIFWMFFRPAEPVQAALDAVRQELHLQPGRYAGVHCRVRHPKAHSRSADVKGKNEEYTADKTGLPWEGEMRDHAVRVATRALQCALKYFFGMGDNSNGDEPVYLFSDSNDLVRYLAHELSSDEFLAANASIVQSNPYDWAALETVKQRKVVARRMDGDNAHIDKQKGRDPPAYYATFVDLFLAVNARCLAYGVGFYAVFASKISGTLCRVLYQEETWGGSQYKGQNVQQCKLPSDK